MHKTEMYFFVDDEQINFVVVKTSKELVWFSQIVLIVRLNSASQQIYMVLKLKERLKSPFWDYR